MAAFCGIDQRLLFSWRKQGVVVPDLIKPRGQRMEVLYNPSRKEEILALRFRPRKNQKQPKEIRNKKSATYARIRWKRDGELRLLHTLRARVSGALKIESPKRTPVKTEALVGCSHSDLRKHFESKFKPGMSWQNYGQWVIDHVVPCCEFDIKTIQGQRHCFHFSNLQPLWDLENRIKANKLNPK